MQPVRAGVLRSPARHRSIPAGDGEHHRCRVVKVHLTAKGRNLRPHIGGVAAEIDAQAWRGFTIMHKRQLNEALQNIWENMNGKSE